MRALIASVVFLFSSGYLFGQSDFEVYEASITELQAALESGEVTSVQLVEKYLARVEAYDKQGPKLNSLIRINPDALQDAAALDAERSTTGARGMLHGIPIIVKDNYNTTNMPTTGSSVALAGFVPNANSTQVDQLLEAGAIVLAKSNLHEFASGITSIGSLIGQTRNPYDPRRVPGGSSGGTSAAVAASLGAIGMGSDTCGSIRIPSAFNNLVGLRPTKGLSSIYGVMPLSHTQDVAGPLARNATDLAIVLDATSGFDPNDEATAIMQGEAAPGFLNQLESVSLQGLRLGKLTGYFERANGRVTSVIDEALELFVEAGAEVVEIEIPELGDWLDGSGLIGHEFRPDLNQYLATFSEGSGSDGSRTFSTIVDQGLFHDVISGSMTRRRNAEFDEEAYQEAYAKRQVVRDGIEMVLQEQQLDAIVYPTIGQLQVITGEPQTGSNCSISANSGLPAISIPAGFTESGLPVGMELLGSFFSDTRLVSIAHQFEKVADTRQAPSTTPPLIDGQPPSPLTRDTISFTTGDIDIDLDFSFDFTTNLLSYRVVNNTQNMDALYAVTLVIDDEGDGPDDWINNNLMGPAMAESQGDIFASPDLRQAIVDGKVFYRVFAEGFPDAGYAGALSFSP